MGILDFFGGGSTDNTQSQDPSFAALRELGLPQGLLDAYQKEQDQNRRMQAMQMVIGGIGNAVSGYQGMAPVAAPSIGASGGGGGAGGIGGLDGLVDRAMKFSQLRSQIQSQQSLAQLKQAIAADPNLSPMEKQAYLLNTEAYLKRVTAPDDLEIKYDTDNRPIGVFNKKTQTMLSNEQAAQKGIQLASGMAPSKAMDMEDSLRKEHSGAGETKRYMEADPIYRSMVKSAPNDTGAADLDLVYGIGKIMDPGSVVREGEMVMVNKASPFAEMLQGYIGSIQGQGKLTPETRARLLEMARTRMGELRSAYDDVTGGITTRAVERKIDPSRVVSRKYEALPDAPMWSSQQSQWVPPDAINSLRSNPTPERQQAFDEAFGAGASARILRGR